MPSWLGSRIKQARMSGGQIGLLLRTSPRLGKRVLQQIPIWDANFGSEFRRSLVELCVTLREQERFVEFLLASLPEHLEGCGNFHRQRLSASFLSLLRLNKALEHSEEWSIELWNVLPSLIRQFDDQWIADWIRGADPSHRTLSEALSQLRLDTQQTQAAWKEATQRVYLQDVQSRLWPYMESHLGSWQGAVQIQVASRAYTDGIDIHLPPFVDGDASTGWQQYRVWVARFSALFEFGSFELNLETLSASLPAFSLPEPMIDELLLERFFRSFPDKRLATQLFFLLEEHRVSRCIAQLYPGVASKVHKQRRHDAEKAARQPKSSVLKRVLSELQLACVGCLEHQQVNHPIVVRHISAIESLAQESSTLYDSIALLQALFADLYALNSKVDMSLTTPFSTEQTSRKRRMVRVQAENSVSHTISLPQAQRKQTTAQDVFEQLDFLHSNPMGAGGLLSERTNETPELKPEFLVDGQEIDSGQYRYPEWDMHLSDGRPNWCLVREVAVQPTPAGIQFCERVQQTHGQEMRKIRSIFQMLKDNLFTRKRGLQDGDRLDFNRWMDARIQRKMRQTPDTNLYSRTERNNRDPAIAFLVDLSSSTNEITKDAVPILDIEKAALLLMAEALSSIGDPFAVYGYSGFGREQVAFFIAKDIDEPWTEATKNKVGSMGWKMENRDGAAIRHAIHKMKDWPEQQRILLLLSDGKPLDCGDKYYFDDYAQSDTRAALLEARSAGITPFCITVDPYGQEYLPFMYGPHGFVAIDNLQNFSHHLAKVYASMTL